MRKPSPLAQLGASYRRDATAVTEERRGNMSAFESISMGLKEALDFAQGDPESSKLHEVSVTKVRQRNGLPKAASAKNHPSRKVCNAAHKPGHKIRRKRHRYARALTQLINGEETGCLGEGQGGAYYEN